MPCFRLRTALFYDLLKLGLGHDLFFLRLGEHQRPHSKFMKTFFFLFENAKNFAENWQFFSMKIFFGKHALCPRLYLLPLNSEVKLGLLVLLIHWQ